MRRVVPLGPYLKDLKRVMKRGWNVKKLHAVVTLLQLGATLPENAYLHKLSGKYAGLWECHIAHDWVLVFDFTGSEVLLARTGSHADLFE